MIPYAEARDARLYDKLYVVATVSNPRRYRSRYDLYRKFAQHVKDSGAELYTVELAFGQRPHVVTEASNPQHLQLRTPYELWHKENSLSLLVSRLPSDWKYVAWVDADVTFARPDWVGETIQMLQHHMVVQMFSEAIDMSPSFEMLQRHIGFMKCYRDGGPVETHYDIGYANRSVTRVTNPWHPGFAWAMRREAYDALGGLIDFGILGAGDTHMARSLVGQAQYSHHPSMNLNYSKMIFDWQARAEKYVRRNVGYVDGIVLHHWHGKKRDRRYKDRWKILVEHDFDPRRDLKRDW